MSTPASIAAVAKASRRSWCVRSRHRVSACPREDFLPRQRGELCREGPNRCNPVNGIRSAFWRPASSRSSSALAAGSVNLAVRGFSLASRTRKMPDGSPRRPSHALRFAEPAPSVGEKTAEIRRITRHSAAARSISAKISQSSRFRQIRLPGVFLSFRHERRAGCRQVVALNGDVQHPAYGIDALLRSDADEPLIFG